MFASTFAVGYAMNELNQRVLTLEWYDEELLFIRSNFYLGEYHNNQITVATLYLTTTEQYEKNKERAEQGAKTQEERMLRDYLHHYLTNLGLSQSNELVKFSVYNQFPKWVIDTVYGQPGKAEKTDLDMLTEATDLPSV